MEKSKRVGKSFQWLAIAAIIALLSGCAHKAPPIRMKSETELAVEAVKTEWLIECSFSGGEQPVNQIGSLLQDYVDLAEAFAICIKRHNAFVGYIKPIIEKERGQ